MSIRSSGHQAPPAHCLLPWISLRHEQLLLVVGFLQPLGAQSKEEVQNSFSPTKDHRINLGVVRGKFFVVIFFVCYTMLYNTGKSHI